MRGWYTSRSPSWGSRAAGKKNWRMAAGSTGRLCPALADVAGAACAAAAAAGPPRPAMSVRICWRVSGPAR